MGIHRILVPLAGSAQTPGAVATAVDLAAAHRALLTGISFRESGERAWLSPLGGSREIKRVRAAEEHAAWERIAATARSFAETTPVATT